MNNEPVAWTDKRQLSRPYPHSDAMTMWANAYPEQGIDIPLYTHPVKELTDEVKDALMDALSGWKYIRQCHGDLYGVGWDRVQEKLEAILRKAQEK